MADFATYELGENVYNLAENLLPRMAEATGFELGDAPDAETIGNFIGHLAPHAELQKNIEHLKELLGPTTLGIAIDWVEESSILTPVKRSFVSETIETPDIIDTVVWSGGVANWMLRRTTLTERLDPEKIGQIYLPIGNRPMGNGEHQLVATLDDRLGRSPVEYEFADAFLLDRLTAAGFHVDLHPIENKNGDAVLAEGIEQHPTLLDGTVMVVTNAPNAIQGAGQFRAAARLTAEGFDANGDQLFMVSDTIPLGQTGNEATATHQNPVSAVGQIVRSALFLQRNQA